MMSSIAFMFAILVAIVTTMVNAQSEIPSNGNETNLLTVSGSGETFVERDTVYVRLAVENKADTAIAAQQNTSSSVEQLIQSLQTFNISKLQTDDVSLTPIYNYTDPAMELLGFQSSVVLSYYVPPPIAGETLDAAVKNGANRILVVSTTSSNNVTDNAYKESLQSATLNAQEKANVVVNALGGLCLGTPLAINVEPTYDSSPVPTPTIFASMEAGSGVAPASQPTVLAGETQVTANVLVTYRLVECSEL